MKLSEIFESAVKKLNEGILDPPDKFMGKTGGKFVEKLKN